MCFETMARGYHQPCLDRGRRYCKPSSRIDSPPHPPSLPPAFLLVTRSVRVKLSWRHPLGGGIKMKCALEGIVQYDLKVISVMDQLLRKFITTRVPLRHSRDEGGGVGEGVRLFNKWKFNCIRIKYLYRSPRARWTDEWSALWGKKRSNVPVEKHWRGGGHLCCEFNAALHTSPCITFNTICVAE